jgi:hypothetical protein
MARNRVIYQSEALYVSKNIGSTASGDHAQLERVQSANYNFSISRQDINQYGQLARIDSIVLEPPTVGLDFTYYLTDGFNERALGFYVQRETGYEVAITGANGSVVGSFITGYDQNGGLTNLPSSGSIASGFTGLVDIQGNFPSGHMINQSGQNFYITTVAEGSDALGSTGVGSTIGIGNAFLTNYSLELAVGSLPTVSVSMEASNMNSDTTLSGIDGGISGIETPAINPENGTKIAGDISLKPANTGASTISALRPGDITINLGTFDENIITDLGTDGNALHIQSASLALPLSRTQLQRLGSKFAYARAVDFPVTATLSVSAILNEVAAENLADMLNDEASRDITLTLKGPNGGANKMIWTLKGCKLDSESFSSSIGSNKSVELAFSTQIGGPNDLANGIFVSGDNKVSTFA